MHEKYWQEGRQQFERQILADRRSGMGWGALSKKYGIPNKANVRRTVQKLEEGARIETVDKLEQPRLGQGMR